MDNVPLDKIVLNKSQKKAKLHIMRGKNVFVTGGAGSGKSILIKAVVEELERTGKRTILCAPTGMAALKIGGTTIHRAFGFPVGPCIVQEKNGAGLSVMTNVSAMLKLADLVLVDEVSLIRADIFDAMVLSIKKAETLTGRRIQLVVIGDFFQLPPVLPRDSIERTLLEAYYGHDIGYAYAFQSHYWDSCRFLTITLDEPMRQKDPKLIDCLNSIRIGDSSKLDVLNNETMNKDMGGALCLYARKDSVTAINQGRLAELEGEAVIFKTMVSYEQGIRKEDLDEQIRKQISPDLLLKVGAQVIFTANDYKGMHNAGKGSSNRAGKEKDGPSYVNGLTGTVCKIAAVGFGSIMGSVTVLTAWGKKVVVEPITVPLYGYFAEEDQLVKKKVASYTQFPLELAYAITIHRSQGQTYYAIRVAPQTFVPGQLYVALSRAVSFEGLSLTRAIVPSDIIISTKVKEFYASQRKEHKRMGRPPKNNEVGVLDRIIWVPDPLEEYVEESIRAGRVTDMQVYPSYAPGRVHKRVPASLSDGILQKIKEWKTWVKDNRKTDEHTKD